MLTDADVPAGVLEQPPEPVVLPDPPDWPGLSDADLALLSGPVECPCCVEPEPVRAAEWWPVPGVTWHEGPPPRPPVSSRVAAVTSAIAALAGHEPVRSGELQAVVDVEALGQALSDLRIGVLPFLVDAHARRLHVTANQPTLGTWRTRVFPDLPPADLTLAGRLRRLSALDAAVQDRRVSLDAGRRVAAALLALAPHVDRPDGLVDGQPADPVIAAVVDNTVELVAGGRAGIPDDDPFLMELEQAAAAIVDGGGSHLDQLEQAFVLLGQHLHSDALSSALGQQRDALLPNELERRAQQQFERRGLRQEQRLDDLPGDITITPDHELHELFWTLMHATATHDPANPADTQAKADEGADHTDPDRQDPLLRDLQRDLHDAVNDAEDDDRDAGIRRPRSKAQRLHDALKLILKQHLAAGLAGSTDKAAVAMTITVPSSLIEGKPGALPGRGRSGTNLPKSLLRRWWSDATVTAYVLTRGLMPLGLIHAGRTLSAAERTAAHLQRGGLCDRVGCCRPDDPLRTLTPHHLFGYATHGRTSLAETIMACPSLHHDIHHGKTVQLRDGRWINQDGPTTPPDPGPWH